MLYLKWNHHGFTAFSKSKRERRGIQLKRLYLSYVYDTISIIKEFPIIEILIRVEVQLGSQNLHFPLCFQNTQRYSKYKILKRFHSYNHVWNWVDRRSWRVYSLEFFRGLSHSHPRHHSVFYRKQKFLSSTSFFFFHMRPFIDGNVEALQLFIFFQVLSNRIFILFFGCKRRNHFVLSSPTIKTNEDEVRLLRRSRRREGTVFCLLTHFNSMMRIRAMLKPGSYEMTFYIGHRRIESLIKHLRKSGGSSSARYLIWTD